MGWSGLFVGDQIQQVWQWISNGKGSSAGGRTTFTGVWSLESTLRVDINEFLGGSGSLASGEKVAPWRRTIVATIFMDPLVDLGDEKRLSVGFPPFLEIFLRNMARSDSFYRWYIVFQKKFTEKSNRVIQFTIIFLLFFMIFPLFGFSHYFLFIMRCVCCCMNCVNGVATVCAICILYSSECMCNVYMNEIYSV